MLELVHLTKQYGGLTALSDFTYSFAPGFYALLGENGSGKSTLIELIAGNLKPDGGTIRYDGRDTARMGAEYRSLIGYMPQEAAFYEQMTGTAFLAYLADLKGLSRAEYRQQIPELLETVHLSEEAGRRIREYSGGMRQRLFLAQALLGRPGILLLDEPTAGMDPTDRRMIVDHLKDRSREAIVLFSTHILSDIETAADQVLFLKNGKLVLSGAPSALPDSPEAAAVTGGGRPASLEEIYRAFFPEEKRRRHE